MAFILIVYSDGQSAERAADAIIAAGHSCGWVTSADQALTLMCWRKPDLMLLEEDMPGTGGTALFRDLRLDESYREMPIILLTAGHSSAAQQTCGAYDDIRKPVDPRFLVWRVNHAIELQASKPERARLKNWLAEQFDAGTGISVA